MRQRKMRSAIMRMFPLIEKISRSKLILIQKSLLHTLPEQEHLKKFIRHFEIDCIFDVGANMGQYATMLREKVGYRGLIVSFEPVPECIERLQALAKSDPLWRVEPVALAERAGTSTFNVMTSNEFSSLNSPDHSKVDIFRDHNAVAEQITVKVGTVAEHYEAYLAEFGFKRPFLKMDTQGNDMKVSMGAGDLLEKFAGLQSELSMIGIYEGSPGYVEAIKYYESRGFRLSAFVPNNSGHFPRLIEMDCIMFNQRFLA